MKNISNHSQVSNFILVGEILKSNILLYFWVEKKFKKKRVKTKTKNRNEEEFTCE